MACGIPRVKIHSFTYADWARSVNDRESTREALEYLR